MIGPLNVTIPDVAEPFVGYRAWHVDLETYELVSYFAGRIAWPVGKPLEAKCERTKLMPARVHYPVHEQDSAGNIFPAFYTSYREYVHVPDPCPSTPSSRDGSHAGFGCGCYAYSSLSDAVGHNMCSGYPWYLLQRSLPLVLGEVYLSGRVMTHATGYRASRGWVKAVYDNHPHSAEVAEKYGVPLLEIDLGIEIGKFAVDRMRSHVEEALETAREMTETAQQAALSVGLEVQ